MTAITQIQVRRDTQSNWNNYNPVLGLGEIGFEQDTQKFKIGDGISYWDQLPYFVNSTINTGGGGGSMYFPTLQIQGYNGQNNFPSVNLFTSSDNAWPTYAQVNFSNYNAFGDGAGIKLVNYGSNNNYQSISLLPDERSGVGNTATLKVGHPYHGASIEIQGTGQDFSVNPVLTANYGTTWNGSLRISGQYDQPIDLVLVGDSSGSSTTEINLSTVTGQSNRATMKVSGSNGPANIRLAGDYNYNLNNYSHLEISAPISAITGGPVLRIEDTFNGATGIQIAANYSGSGYSHIQLSSLTTTYNQPRIHIADEYNNPVVLSIGGPYSQNMSGSTYIQLQTISQDSNTPILNITDPFYSPAPIKIGSFIEMTATDNSTHIISIAQDPTDGKYKLFVDGSAL